VATQYPINTQTPTTTISTPHVATTTSREAVAWVAVIYALLLVFFLALAIGFIYTIHKDRSASDAKANHVLYDNLNPSKGNTRDEEE